MLIGAEFKIPMFTKLVEKATMKILPYIAMFQILVISDNIPNKLTIFQNPKVKLTTRGQFPNFGVCISRIAEISAILQAHML